MRKITADYLFPIHQDPMQEQVLIMDSEHRIAAIEPLKEHDSASVEFYQGVLIPGFINTHCHLELSHLRGRVDTGTTLLPFLKAVVSLREVPQEEIDAAIEEADRAMYVAGIQAVGDISNKLDTAAIKGGSPIDYYTFVEMFDFMHDAWAEKTFADYRVVYEGQSDLGNNRKQAVPHAPYTVSPSLFQKINALNDPSGTVSIHNQETAEENVLFQTGGGSFPDFFRHFNVAPDHFEPIGKPSIYYAMDQMDPTCRTLFVHNTMTTEADILAAQAWGQNGVYWATCPNANLYIENRLPHYQRFLNTNANVTIGTDSLTSNWQLSILEELKTIARYQSYVPFATLLRWATLNGAAALGYADRLGSLEVGKSPGLVLLEHLEGQEPASFQFGTSTTARRII